MKKITGFGFEQNKFGGVTVRVDVDGKQPVQVQIFCPSREDYATVISNVTAPLTGIYGHWDLGAKLQDTEYANVIKFAYGIYDKFTDEARHYEEYASKEAENNVSDADYDLDSPIVYDPDMPF